MLDLVLSHGNGVGAVQQDVRRLQDGIVQQPRHHLLLPRRLLLELRLPLQLAKRRHRVEDPREFRMLRDLRLHEQGALGRIDPCRQQSHRHLVRPAPQLLGRVRHSDGVIIYHAEERLGLILQRHPILHGAKVISDMQFARRLDPAEDARHTLKLRLRP